MRYIYLDFPIKIYFFVTLDMYIIELQANIYLWMGVVSKIFIHYHALAENLSQILRVL